MRDYINLIKEQIDAGKIVSLVPRGKSMEPMLTGGEDMVLLKKVSDRLHLYDVALYYRKETQRYVLHRVVGFSQDGNYIMCGDNNLENEYNITDDDIIAVVTAFSHKGKMTETTSRSYKIYCNFWYTFKPLRIFYLRVKSFTKKLRR